MSLSELHDRLHDVLVRQLDGFRNIITLNRLSGGASQETYRLEVKTDQGVQIYAIRRAPEAQIGDSGGVGLDIEARLFASAKRAGVPGPDIIYLFGPEDELGEGFLMEWIEGETLGSRVVRDERFADIRPKLAYQCGEILGRIHQIDVTSEGLDKKLNRLSTDDFIRQLWEQYQSLDTLQPMIDYTARWLLENQPNEGREALVHNDFRNGNLMIEPERGITAVLDWEVAHIGNPLRDLGWICTNSWRFGRYDLPVGGFGQREDLLAGYKAATGTEIKPEELIYWEVFGSFWWAIGCLRMADRYDKDPAVGVEYPAIGRRSSECQIDCVNYLIPGAVKMPEKQPSKGRKNMPDMADLVESVRTFCSAEVTPVVSGRTGFLSRVGANSLDIVLRELLYGNWQQDMEQQLLRQIFHKNEPTNTLKRKLVEGLRDNCISLETDGLAPYLRQQVFTQIAIDQPSYSGFKVACWQGGVKV